MTGDFIFGVVVGAVAMFVILFVAGWLRQSSRGWSAEIEEAGR